MGVRLMFADFDHCSAGDAQNWAISSKKTVWIRPSLGDFDRICPDVGHLMAGFGQVSADSVEVDLISAEIGPHLVIL